MASDTEVDLEIDDKDHGTSVLKRFGWLREKELRCDLTITVGKYELKVNRELMIVTSDYIAAMFAHDTLEKQTGVVDMKDVEFEFVKKCIDFIYTGKISISFNKCERLLYVACLMQLWTLREHIGLFLKKHLTVSSFFNIRRIAVKFSIENLTKFCNEFAYENMDFINGEKEFMEMDGDSVLSILNVKKSASTGGEDIKVSSILKWIKFNAKNRKKLLVKMLNSVDLKNVSKSYGRYLVENEPLCYQSADCTRMFYLATMDSFGVKRRKMDSQPSESPNAIVIFDTKSNALQAFKPSIGTWSIIHNLHTDMIGNVYTAASLKRYLFVLMGNKKVFKLNIVENDLEWTRMKDTLQERGTEITATVLEDFIYVAGNNTMERYSLRQDCWQMINTDGISLQSCVLVANMGCVYSIGTGAHSYVLKEANKPLESVCWNPIAPLQVGGKIYSTVSYNWLIYVSSQGHQDHCYNPSTNTWTTFQSAFYYHRRLRVAEGLLFSLSNKNLYLFDFQGKMWSPRAKVPCGEIAGRATVSVLLPD